MSAVLDKKHMTEEDIKLNYITPALHARGWKDKITMETAVYFTDGQIKLRGNVAVRAARKKADYVLYLNANNPIAIVEAKDNNHGVSDGLGQAKEYARHLDVPFAYSSNGDAFTEYDFLTGIEKNIPLNQFPTFEELTARYKRETNDGAGLSSKELAAIAQPYYTGQNTWPPRYYQRAAVNRTLDAIARGQRRLLLVMATGTGKTYTAFQLVYRLLKAGMIRKVLYLADRNILVDQTIQQDFAPLAKTIHKIDYAREEQNAVTSYEVYFSLYQQLSRSGDEDEDGEEDALLRLKTLFSPDFFDLVIVDECHRGSAKKESAWRAILEYFKGAIQLGMTATPKETKYTSNIDYFGEPVYTYSLKQGIEDGFLAPFRVINITTNISNGWRPAKDQRDAFGNVIEDREYNNGDYDYSIVIQDRTRQVAAEITRYLKSTDRMAKTIVFCATEDAAERMRAELSNQNADMMKINPDYVVRITGSDTVGKSKLDYFISTSSKYPVIATTSKLLSTGADCKMTKLIVLDEMIGSMTEFKQIVGRGTRLREDLGKTHFVIMDFRGVTRLFADPDWDGPIEQDVDYDPKRPASSQQSGGGGGERTVPPIVGPDGCRVEIIQKTVSVYDADGKLLRQENIVDYTKSNIRGICASLEEFLQMDDKQQKITELLKERGIDLASMKKDQGMEDVDDFDFLCHVAFDQKPKSRRERAENVKKRDFLSRYGEQAREVLNAIIDRYARFGIYEIENRMLLTMPDMQKFGRPAQIASIFGGVQAYFSAIHELERELYDVA